MAGEREGKLSLAAFEPEITLKVTVWVQRRVNFSILLKEIQEACSLGASLNCQISSPEVFMCFVELCESWHLEHPHRGGV